MNFFGQHSFDVEGPEEIGPYKIIDLKPLILKEKIEAKFSQPMKWPPSAPQFERYTPTQALAPFIAGKHLSHIGPWKATSNINQGKMA